jgi:menaquinone-dependent protoporphyrinogen IX oxidase
MYILTGQTTMNTLIIYESIYGSTQHYAEWLAERIADATVASIDALPPLAAYDAIILGYPVYRDVVAPMTREFLKQRREELRSKRVAVFVVCLDGPMSFVNGRLHGAFQYLQQTLEMFAVPPIHAAAFPGEIHPGKLSDTHRDALLQFYRKVLKRPVEAVPYKTGINKTVCWEFAETFLQKLKTVGDER